MVAVVVVLVAAFIGGQIGHAAATNTAPAASGTPLIEIVASEDIEAKLGAEPEDVRKIAPGQKVGNTKTPPVRTK